MILMKCSLTYMPLKISQLFVSVSFFLWPFSISIYLAYLQRDVFLQRGKKCSPVLKSCCQDPDIGEDFFLSSLHYFPEQTVISSIFHAYGHECLTLPHLHVSKKEISWLQFSFEDKEDMKISLEIWCVSCWLTPAFLCFSFPSCWCQWQTLLSTCPSPCPIPAGNKEVKTFSEASFCDTYTWWCL